MANATVRLENTDGLSNLNITYTGVKEIIVSITNNLHLEIKFPYKKILLVDFLYAISKCNIEEIDVGPSVTSEQVDVFISIIRQVNEHVDIHDITDVDSNYIIGPAVPSVKHELSYEIPKRCELYARKLVDMHIIKNLIKIINNYKLAGRPVPNFTKKTRAQYKKIKNFIYSATHMALSNEEIDLIAAEVL
jgi:hypothetical protein